MDAILGEYVAIRFRKPSIDIPFEIDCLVVSSEPAVVFASLARLCVPAFSDACTVDIVEGRRTGYRIDYPSAVDVGPSGAAVGPWTIHTQFESADSRTAHHYMGVISHTWRERQPTPTDMILAKVFSRHAVTVIRRERASPDTCHDNETIDLVSRRRDQQRQRQREQARRARSRASPL